MPRRLSSPTLAVRLAVFCGFVLVGCGRGCDNSSSSPPPHMEQKPLSFGCSADFSEPDPVLSCPATLEDVPTFCDDPELVCNYAQLDSRVRCACENGRWSCIDFGVDLGVKPDDLAETLSSDDLGEED